MTSRSVGLAVVGTALCAGSALAGASWSITSATSEVGTGSGCSDSCDALAVPACDLACDGSGAKNVEVAFVSLAVTPITISGTATAEAAVVAGRGGASALAQFAAHFTLSQPTTVYANWSVFFPPADSNFVPSPPPAGGEWLGVLPAGEYFVSATLNEVVPPGGLGGESETKGILVRFVPDPDADCDGDGTPDWREIVEGTQSDSDFDGIPDDCDNPADLDGDGVVSASDLAILLGAWGGSGVGDLDGNGVVAAPDLGILLGAWN